MATKEDILNKIRESASKGEPLTFDFATMPNVITVADIALEVQKLTGKNVHARLKELADKGESVDFPFNELKQQTPQQPSAPGPTLPAQTDTNIPGAPLDVAQPTDTQTANVPPSMPASGSVQESPTMRERFKAGFLRKELPQPQGFDVGDVAQFAGENIMPAAGAAVGALSTAPTWLPTGMSSAMAGGMAGAAAGRSVQNTIAESMKEKSERTGLPGLLADPVLASLEFGLGEGIASKLAGKSFLGKAPRAIAPHGRGPKGEFLPPAKRKLGRAEDTMASWLKTGPGIDDLSAEAVVRDPEILWRAGPLAQVEKAYGNWMKGLNGRVTRAKQYFGDETPSFARIKKVLPDIEESVRTGHGHGTKQYLESLLTAREQIAQQMQKGTLGDPEQKVLRRYWQDKINFFDKTIEKERPGYAKVRQMYNEALINKQFNNLLPIDAAGHPNMLKVGGMGAALSGGASAIGSGTAPMLGTLAIGGAMAMSPVANKAALLSYAAGKRLANVALTAKLPASMTAALLREALKTTKTPEERNQLMEYIVQQKKTQPPVANERPIEEVLTSLQEDPAGLYEVELNDDEGLF